MANSGVNTAFAKCFIFFMALVILLQGGIYLGLSIWGITLRQCSRENTDIINKPFQFAMDLIYFLNEDCGNPSVKVSMSESITLHVDFNKAEPVENRTFIFCITYAVISTLWIVTSLAIITSLCGPMTKSLHCLCFWPWFLFVMAGSILDAAATGYHIHDIINTTSAEKTFKYLGITDDEKTMEVLSNFDTYFITPAILMTCISSRVILVWLLNIFGSSFCLSLSKRNSSNQNSATSLVSTNTAPVTNVLQQSRKEILPVHTQHQQESSTPTLPSLEIQSLQTQSPTVPVPNLYQKDPSPNENLTNIDMATNYHNTEEHPYRLNYPPQFNTSQYPQELSPLSPLNNRYSMANDSLQFPMQNQRVSEELRGQLPWSYTSIPPPVPKKTQTQVYPEIPTPDYGH